MVKERGQAVGKGIQCMTREGNVSGKVDSVADNNLDVEGKLHGPQHPGPGPRGGSGRVQYSVSIGIRMRRLRQR